MTGGAGEVELVLFDLGGVLVRLGGLGVMQGLASTGSEDELWAGGWRARGSGASSAASANRKTSLWASCRIWP